MREEKSIELTDTILEAIMKTRGEDKTEPLDGDDIQLLTSNISSLIDTHEGNTKELDESEQAELIKTLIKCTIALGWDLALYNPTGNEDAELTGISIGNSEYLEKITEAFEKFKNETTN
jgi:hypothetical protein